MTGNDTIPPSLIFGGYDSSRLDPTSTISARMAEEFGSELTVKLLDITASDKSGEKWQLSSNAINVRIDSIVSQMWLPIDVCRAFETTFGLKWDEPNGLYLVNEALHETLLSRDISVNITIEHDGFQLTLDFPYSMFDLKIGPPYIDTSSHYFPIRRANTSLYYILGRSFLQRAYITVDYDRQRFNVSRAVYDPASKSHILNILPPSASEKLPDIKDNKANKNNKKTITGATIAGISIGLFAVLVALGVIFCQYLKRKALKEHQPGDLRTLESDADSLDPGFIKAELEGEGKPRLELEASNNEKKELGSIVAAVELDSTNISPLELPAYVPIYEVQEGKRYSYQDDMSGKKG
jgi:hypothetical protein